MFATLAIEKLSFRFHIKPSRIQLGQASPVRRRKELAGAQKKRLQFNLRYLVVERPLTPAHFLTFVFITLRESMGNDVTNDADLPAGPQPDLLELTAEIVAAYVSNNRLQPAELGSLIRDVRASLSALGQPAQETEPAADKPNSAQIGRSITPNALISFVDGKPYKTLKRHLSRHGLDLPAYRARYGLPEDYPSTAPNYSATRAEIARTLGLGRYGMLARGAVEPDAAPASEDTPKRRGRPKKPRAVADQSA